MTGTIELQRWTDLATRERFNDDLDRIFFQSSLTKTFADDAARAAFRERWLGRFLGDDARLAHVALDTDAGNTHLIGYVVGAHDDPARSTRFNDIGYFAELADVTARFPAHLHINMAPEARGQGIGQRLVERFAADTAVAGLPGFHVVTGATSRNVAFYRRCGLVHEHLFEWHSSRLVLLGRSL